MDQPVQVERRIYISFNSGSMIKKGIYKVAMPGEDKNKKLAMYRKDIND